MESRAANVVLVKKRIDDIFQRWIVKDNGLVFIIYELKLVDWWKLYLGQCLMCWSTQVHHVCAQTPVI